MPQDADLLVFLLRVLRILFLCSLLGRSTQTSKTVSLSWKGFGMEEQMSPRAASIVRNELWELPHLKASCFWGQREALLEGKCVASSVASSVALAEFETL